MIVSVDLLHVRDLYGLQKGENMDEWIENEGQCATCHYWTEDGKGHSCMNFNSPFAADWTDEDDGCNSYTPKRGGK